MVGVRVDVDRAVGVAVAVATNPRVALGVMLGVESDGRGVGDAEAVAVGEDDGVGEDVGLGTSVLATRVAVGEG